MTMRKFHQISERIYVLPYQRKGDRPNLFYIKGDKYSIAIDAGNSKKHVEKFYKSLSDNNLPLPKYTIISHWHWDHTFGLSYISGSSISTVKTNNKLKELKTWKWDKKSMKNRLVNHQEIKMCNDNIIIEYPILKDIKIKEVDKTIKSNKTLDLGGIKVELIPMESTHSDDSLFIYIKNKALFVQDADWINPYISMEYNQDKLKRMIKFLKKLKYKDYYLGHVPPETKKQAINRLTNELR